MESGIGDMRFLNLSKTSAVLSGFRRSLVARNGLPTSERANLRRHDHRVIQRASVICQDGRDVPLFEIWKIAEDFLAADIRRSQVENAADDDAKAANHGTAAEHG